MTSKLKCPIKWFVTLQEQRECPTRSKERCSEHKSKETQFEESDQTLQIIEKPLR
jgi:hypothetical protein